MTSKDIIFGAVVVVVATCLSWFLIVHNVTGNGGTPIFGAVGSLQAENYIPYVRTNGGYNSAMPISSTGLLTVTGGSALSGGTTITGVSSHSGLATFTGGSLNTFALASTTITGTETLLLADVNTYDTVIYNPNVAGVTTLTFPASSTVSTWLPTAGSTQKTCFVNGTTTAGVIITFAGGTGTKLLVASSSATALGSVSLYPQKIGCFNFVRGNSTATTFDILGAFTAYQ